MYKKRHARCARSLAGRNAEDQIVRLLNALRCQLITRALLRAARFYFPSSAELNYSAHLITKTSKPREEGRRKKPAARVRQVRLATRDGENRNDRDDGNFSRNAPPVSVLSALGSRGLVHPLLTMLFI